LGEDECSDERDGPYCQMVVNHYLQHHAKAETATLRGVRDAFREGYNCRLHMHMADEGLFMDVGLPDSLKEMEPPACMWAGSYMKSVEVFKGQIDKQTKKHLGSVSELRRKKRKI